MAISDQKNAADLYETAEELKARVMRVKIALQDVISYSNVLESLPAYSAGTSNGDKNLINGIQSSSVSIIATIDAINWTF